MFDAVLSSTAQHLSPLAGRHTGRGLLSPHTHQHSCTHDCRLWHADDITRMLWIYVICEASAVRPEEERAEKETATSNSIIHFKDTREVVDQMEETLLPIGCIERSQCLCSARTLQSLQPSKRSDFPQVVHKGETQMNCVGQALNQ